MEGATVDLMEEFELEPGAVRDIHLAGGSLAWAGSSCATGFTVSVYDMDNQELAGLEEVATAGRSLALPDLAACTEYNFWITPIVGGFSSDGDMEEAVLAAAPSVAALAALRPAVAAGEGEVTLTWPVTQDVRSASRTYH